MGKRGREWVLSNRSYERIADLVEDIYSRFGAPAAGARDVPEERQPS
jgi:hypothetical protein